MLINEIKKEECKTARSLWEEVFYEDSVQFTDYYFENKAEKNIGYVMGRPPYDAMLFRTPYVLQIGKERKEISYIVGVATRKECRHRGYMRELLMHSLKEMYKEKQPFTFLMPANPAIYEPFDFRYVYEKESWELKEPEKMSLFLERLSFREEENTGEEGIPWMGNFNSQKKLNGLYSVRKLQEQMPEFPILDLLPQFANKMLEKKHFIYVYRDRSYYEMQLKESMAQNGDIYVFLEQGILKAYFLYAKEKNEIFIQEVIEERERTLFFLKKTEQKKPVIMARIVHLEEMMKLVCCKESTTVLIGIEDDLLLENTGIYQWEITPDGSRVTKMTSKVCIEDKEIENEKISRIPEVIMHIEEFAMKFLNGVYINEIV